VEIRDLFSALRRFWPLSLLVFCISVALGVAAAYLPKERYSSTATLIVSPAGQEIDFNTVDTVRFLLPSLAAQVRTGRFGDEVESSVPAVDFGGVSIDAAEEAGTSILEIEVEAYDPTTAAIVANAAARNLASSSTTELVKIEVLDPARPSSTPVSPNKPLILFAAAVLGLILAVLAALGANAARPRVRTTDEIRRRFGLEVIGEIPHRKDFPKQTSRLFDPRAGHIELVESFQRLRANFEIVAAGRHAVGVTSSTAGEGKSAVTASLAWAVAALGQQVVAVDSDLRRPTLHEYFGARPGSGVADIPLGAEIERITLPTGLPTLRFLPAGFAAQHPTSILHSAYPQVLEAYDDAMLIVDMPPVLGTADAVLVATMTKAVILVADAKHGDPAELEQVLRDLDRAGAQVLGVVMNRATVRRSGRTDVYYTEFARQQAVPKRRGLRARLFPEPAPPAPPTTEWLRSGSAGPTPTPTPLEPVDETPRRRARGS
jgi:capsular exopolysaccharide synthesis family protein